MPIQAPQWTDFLSCPVCCNEFDADGRGPVSLGCGHSICRGCLASLHRKQCPFDQSAIRVDVFKIPLNSALVRLVGGALPEEDVDPNLLPPYNVQHYLRASRCIQDLALYLKPFSSGSVSVLSRPMQRKLVTLANCQLLEGEGRSRALRAARSLGERTVTELLLQHQNPQQLSANLWAAVRARGCQFLGPAMQEEVLKLVLLALEDGSALSRKVLVMFVVQRLEPHYSQASKTSIGHVVQLLYRASCFKVSKREGDSSLMQLKEEFRSYEALRREHDAQIVQIATEAGLRIAPDQWSALLYGDTSHKSHMQSIMDKLQTPQSFSQSVQELVMALQRSGDPGNLSPLRHHLELLASIDSSPESTQPTWEATVNALEAASVVVAGLAEFISQHGSRRQQDNSHSCSKYKVSMCRDLTLRGSCPRGVNCTFAHSESEMDRFRGRVRKPLPDSNHEPGDSNAVVMPAMVVPPPFEPDMYEMHSGALSRPHFTATADTQWRTPDKLINAPRSRNMANLRQKRLEIVLLPGGQPAEQDHFLPYEPTLLNKYATVSQPYLDSLESMAVLGEDNQSLLPATTDAVRNININAPPQWHRQRPSLCLSEADSHFYVQAPQNLVAESQRVKQQLRSLERKIMDLKLMAIEDTHQNHLVDELRRIQEGLKEEELYEAGIAEDMKELEQRWESELAEQERQWSETDTKPVN